MKKTGALRGNSAAWATKVPFLLTCGLVLAGAMLQDSEHRSHCVVQSKRKV